MYRLKSSTVAPHVQCPHCGHSSVPTLRAHRGHGRIRTPSSDTSHPHVTAVAGHDANTPSASDGDHQHPEGGRKAPLQATQRYGRCPAESDAGKPGRYIPWPRWEDDAPDSPARPVLAPYAARRRGGPSAMDAPRPTVVSCFVCLSRNNSATSPDAAHGEVAIDLDDVSLLPRRE